MLVGAQHPIDERDAVAAAARGDQEIRRFVEHGRAGSGGGSAGPAAAQVAGVDDLAAAPRPAGRCLRADRRTAAGRRPRSRRRGRSAPGPRSCAPLRRQQPRARPSRRAGRARAACRGRLSTPRCRRSRRAGPSGSLSTMNRSGSKTSAVCRMIEARSARVSSMPMSQAERRVLAVAQLDDAGDADEVDPVRKLKLPMIGEPDRISTDRSARWPTRAWAMCPAAAEMAEAERVVAIDQQTVLALPAAHPSPYGRLGAADAAFSTGPRRRFPDIGINFTRRVKLAESGFVRCTSPQDEVGFTSAFDMARIIF